MLKSKFSGQNYDDICDCWMAVSDKTINRATNVFNFIYLYLLFLGNEMKIDGDLRAELGVAC